MAMKFTIMITKQKTQWLVLLCQWPETILQMTE